MPELLLERFAAMPRGGVDPADGLRIEPGTIADFDALAHHHYKRGRPATWVKVLRMVDPGEKKGPAAAGKRRGQAAEWQSEGKHPALIAVLVVSMPTLNGAWRRVAWPGDEACSRRTAAERLNARVRCISRVVVEPRWRAMGVASRLVRAYLADPLTERTETVASMGELCPIFRAAGMRRVEVPAVKADTRLREKLGALGIDPADVSDVLERPGVVGALRSWGWRSCAYRRAVRAQDHGELARRAAERLAGPRGVYVWGETVRR